MQKGIGGMKKMKSTPFEKITKKLGATYTVERTGQSTTGMHSHGRKHNYICLAPDTDIIVGDCLTCGNSRYHVKNITPIHLMGKLHYLEVYI